MNFENRIEATRQYLTVSEQKIADFILTNPEQVVEMNISDLAKASGTSAATVSRLVKSLQINSFTSMKVLISSNLAAKKEEEGDKRLDITANESFASISNKLIKNETDNINQTKDLLNEKLCTDVVSRLLKTKRIYVFGVGASSLAARNIYQKWTRIGCDVVLEGDMHVLLAQLINASENDTLWLISNSGETPECLYLAEYAKKRHICVITLTMFGQNSLLKKANLALTTCKPIEPDIRVGATNSITGQFYVIDVLFYLYFSRNFKSSLKAIEASRKQVRDYKTIF